MNKRKTVVREDPARYYSEHRILGQIEEQPVEFALDDDLRKQILEGKRLRRLQNISIKLDSAQIIALKKVASMKSIPYQTLIRLWLADGIRKELCLASK
jgi:predicted DNA binding CopG/RHH family protein